MEYTEDYTGDYTGDYTEDYTGDYTWNILCNQEHIKHKCLHLHNGIYLLCSQGYILSHFNFNFGRTMYCSNKNA